MSSNIRTIPGWESMTGEQLVQFCQVHPETAIPIPAQSLRNWFADNRFAWLNIQNAWVGPLVDAIASATDEEAAGLERLFSHLSFPGSQVVDTDKDSHAGLLLFVMHVLQPSSNQLAAFYSEADGRKYPLFASSQQADECRDTAIAEDAKAAEIKATGELFEAVAGVIRDKLHTREISTWAEVEAIVEGAG